MKRLLLILFVLLPMMLSAQNLVPKKHPKNDLYGYWGEKKNGKAGFVIKPQFSEVTKFVGGHAFVCKKGVWYIIGGDGKAISDVRYSNVDLKVLEDNHYRVWQHHLCGIVDLKSCKTVFAEKYNRITVFKSGVYKLESGHYQGLSKSTGEEIIPIEYTGISEWKPGVYKLQRDGLQGLATADGKVFVPVRYTNIREWNTDVYWLEYNGSNCLADSSGEVIYKSACLVEDGVYALYNNGKWIFVDKAGVDVDMSHRTMNYEATCKITTELLRCDKSGWNSPARGIQERAKYWQQHSCVDLFCENCGVLIFNTRPDEIVDYAFYECKSLRGIIIPDGVVSIGSCAFYNDVHMESVTIPSSVTEIRTHAFYNCAGELTVNCNIPDAYKKNSYDTYGTGAFVGSKFTKVLIGENVSSIGARAFEDCKSLTSITIPNSVTLIGKRAFYDCDGLTSVTIPNSVTSIGEAAFCSCGNLTNVTLPDGITYICSDTFAYCSSLENIVIPDSVRSIEGAAFKGCVLLTDITFNDKLYGFGTNAFKGCKRLRTIVIPHDDDDSYGYISAGTFEDCENLQSVTIGNGIKCIGDNAFSNCYLLKDVALPDSLRDVGSNVFKGCYSLPEADGIRYADTYLVRVIDRSVTSVNIKPGTIAIGEGAFSYRENLTSVTIPDSVIRIGNEAFSYCENLTSVTIGNGVTDIGHEAFYNCENLSDLQIGKSVRWIRYRAFQNCSSLTNVVIPDSVCFLGYYSFSDCSSLRDLTIGKGVETIGESAFYGCENLTNVYISDLSAWCKIKFVPSEIWGRIYGWTSNPLWDTPARLYLNNKLITDLVIPSDIQEIKDYAFASCQHITSLTIPDSVTHIGENAFNSCHGLKMVKIGAGLKTIDRNAFFHCSKLSEVYIQAKTPPTIGDKVFHYDSEKPLVCNIYVLDESVLKYRYAENWNDYAWSINGF